MNLSGLESLVRLAIPGATLQVIDSPSLWVYINKGVDDVNQRLKIRKKNVKFAAVASQMEYTISTLVSDFVCMDDSGLYYNSGSLATPSYNQLIPKDRKWLDENLYNWRNYSSGVPIYYYQENDTIAIITSPSASLTDAFWIYYIQAAVSMSNGDQYPFVGTTTEVPAFRCLDDGIVAYCQWKLQALLGSKAQGVMDLQAYLMAIEVVDSIYNRRPDVNSSRYFRMQGITVSGDGT